MYVFIIFEISVRQGGLQSAENFFVLLSQAGKLKGELHGL